MTALAAVHPDRLTDPAAAVLRLVATKRECDRFIGTVHAPLNEMPHSLRHEVDAVCRNRRAATRALVDLVAQFGGRLETDGIECFLTLDGMDVVIVDPTGTRWPVASALTRPFLDACRSRYRVGLAAYHQRQRRKARS